jgi:hypothetical protein
MSNMSSPDIWAPVAIFAYRRPDHLRDTLETLMACDGFERCQVIVHCDGPRSEAEREAVEATRELARSMLGERARYHFSEHNKGLSNSIIGGVNAALEEFDRVIVVEDDLELSPGFLTYMNAALERYADEENVYQVSGYMLECPEINRTSSALFLPFAISWGWATWRRAWQHFEPEAPGWERLCRVRSLRYKFNVDGNYGYSNMLVRQMAGLVDSWAVRWNWSVFTRGGLVLFPPMSLVRNTGFDGSGSHGRGHVRHFAVRGREGEESRGSIAMPAAIQLDQILYGYAKDALWRQNGGWLGWLVDRIRWRRTVWMDSPSGSQAAE